MAEIRLNGVAKIYPGGVRAVEDIAISVPDGAFCVLVGPSGCGKSTLLRMVAGLETVSEGTVEIGGRVVNELEPGQRDIAMVFQNYALYPHMSVRQNMAYGLRNRGTPKAEIERKVAEAARILNLEALLDRRPGQLSGGQRQRVAMGRAIVRSPQAFLFDEPLSNLDAKLRVQMRVEIKRLQRALGVTALYVTHDQVEAMTLSDVLVVMHAGRIEQIGAPAEIYARPASRFVATFIGSPPMNILPAEIAPDRSVMVGSVPLPVRAPDRLPAGSVELGMRPEDLLPATQDDAVPFLVEFREDLGASHLLHGTLGDSPCIVHVSAGSVGASGETRLTLPPAERLHWFDPATGARL